jgi:hypothetical protein
LFFMARACFRAETAVRTAAGWGTPGDYCHRNDDNQSTYHNKADYNVLR